MTTDATTPGVYCTASGLPVKECIGDGLTGLEPSPPVSQGVGDDRERAELPADAPDSPEVVAGDEDGMLGLAELFDGYPPPAAHRAEPRRGHQ